MFNPNGTIINAFVQHTLDQFRRMFPEPDSMHLQSLEQAARTELETLLHCDCPYHDIQHTILVTDVGFSILQGRQLARGDLTSNDWIQAVVAMLFHDIGYLRSLLAEDEPGTCVTGESGHRVTPPEGSTDAFMTPYHVSRGKLFIKHRFAKDPVIDASVVADCIEMTRFPVPAGGAYLVADSLAGLVRAADLIGQMADPQYLQKLSRLYAEFVETGQAARMGFANADALRAGFPDFFYAQVHPYIGEGVACLKRTQVGRQWIANLYHHLHLNHANRDSDPKLRAPELVVDNA